MELKILDGRYHIEGMCRKYECEKKSINVQNTECIASKTVMNVGSQNEPKLVILCAML